MRNQPDIENIVTTTAQLLPYAQGPDNADPATKEAPRYRIALHQGFQSLKAHLLCTATAVQVCRIGNLVDKGIVQRPAASMMFINGLMP